MLIYDKSGRKLRYRSLLSFFVVEILTTQESVAKLNPQMVISPQQRKIIKFCGGFSSTFIIDHITKPIHCLLANVGGDTF